MKEIKAIIRHSKLWDVITELNKIPGLPGITISEIKGFGKSRGFPDNNKPKDEIFDFVHKTKIEIVVNDEMVEEILEIIQKYCHTGNPGDGKIIVVNIEEVLKIRTNERGIKAI